MHPSFEQWVEYHEGQLPEPRRAELEAHLDSGCSACRAMETEVKRLVAALTGDRLLDPSAAAVCAAEAAFHPQQRVARLPDWARGLRETLAGLVFDSYARPEAAFAGARSASVARRLCYETQGLELDVLVESEGDQRRMTGQLLLLGTPARPLGGARFAVTCSGVLVGEGETDARGEFVLSMDLPGEVELRVVQAGRLVTFRIPEPFFHPESEE